MKTLEAEERARLQALTARIDALVAEQRPTPGQIDELLVSALQAQATLGRSTRLFPLSSDSRRIDKARALAHGPTTALGGQLYRCWSALGVTAATQRVLLEKVLLSVGTETSKARAGLFPHLGVKWRKGIHAETHAAFAAEGTGQCCIQELQGIRLFSPFTPFATLECQPLPERF